MAQENGLLSWLVCAQMSQVCRQASFLKARVASKIPGDRTYKLVNTTHFSHIQPWNGAITTLVWHGWNRC
jgi:hypothetical protein